jgi:hypothetical protein
MALVYGSNNQTITISLNSLADGATVFSSEISNTSDLFLDVLIRVIVLTESSAIDATGYITVFVVASADGAGGTYPDGANDELKPIMVFNANVASTTYNSPLASIASAFGGVVPEKFKIGVKNDTGNALESTGNSAHYQGIKLS